MLTTTRILNRRMLSLLCLAGLPQLGCESKPKAPELPASAPLQEVTSGPSAAPAHGQTGNAVPSTHLHMPEHDAQAQAMKSAIIRGDLTAFGSGARWIAEHPIAASAPPSWRPYAEAMQGTAKSAVGATDLEGAAKHLGQLGQRCGDCHRAVGGPQHEAVHATERSVDVAHHMLRHQLAADGMWNGLIGP